jgi:predicted nucleotidyltransferase component of viral defense system
MLDLSADEMVVRPPVLAQIAHPYPDSFPSNGTVRCYSFEELFAEKIRAMAQRGRPRGLYDIINLFRRHDLRMYPEAIRLALVEKCAAKSIAVPKAADFVGSVLLAELESEWENMLGHQLPALPPLAIPGRAAIAVRVARRTVRGNTHRRHRVRERRR